jgi:hypothetical protein
MYNARPDARHEQCNASTALLQIDHWNGVTTKEGDAEEVSKYNTCETVRRNPTFIFSAHVHESLTFNDGQHKVENDKEQTNSPCSMH